MPVYHLFTLRPCLSLLACLCAACKNQYQVGFVCLCVSSFEIGSHSVSLSSWRAAWPQTPRDPVLSTSWLLRIETFIHLVQLPLPPFFNWVCHSVSFDRRIKTTPDSELVLKNMDWFLNFCCFAVFSVYVSSPQVLIHILLCCGLFFPGNSWICLSVTLVCKTPSSVLCFPEFPDWAWGREGPLPVELLSSWLMGVVF